ncbi:restriction endonuclease subunit S [Mycoplasma aquilae ATCC BAA-1896]|uniref:restriction endonuclease subunit S n=1 Tax=Mycoplasma aquilae TaxID=1312741 RepID=UPI003A835069
MQKEKLVPEIRFKGFEGKWVEYELGSLYSFLKGSNLSQDSFYYSNDKKAIAYGHLYTIYGPVINAVHLSSNEKTSLISKKNDLLFPGSSTVPLGTAQANAIMLNGVKLGGDIICARPIKDNVDSQFVSYQINAQKYKLFPIISGTTISHMYASGLKNTKWKFTTLNEQSTISDFFNNLLILIQSQELKLKKLNEVKQSLLNKMFASENQKSPEIRFKGFEEEWTKEILKKLVTTFSGLTNVAKEDFSFGENYYVTYLNVFSNPMAKLNDLEKVNIHSKQNNLIKGDILVTGSSETPEEVGMTSIWNYNFENVYLNSFCFGLRPKNLENINIDFSAYLFRSLLVRKQIILLAQGISRFNISKNKFLEVSLTFPIYAEQQKIGQFFSNLDSLIQSQELKLEKLNNIKQALLEKMFC